MRRKADYRNKEGDIHAYKNFHEQSPRITLNVHLYIKSRKHLVGIGAITKAGLIIIFPALNAEVLDGPAVNSFLFVKLTAGCIGYKNQGLVVKQSILNLHTKVLAIEREIMNVPIFFHGAFHFHDSPGFSVYTIQYDFRWFNFFGIRNIQLFGEIKIRIIVHKPEPKPDGVFFLMEVYVVHTDNIGAYFNRIGRG